MAEIEACIKERDTLPASEVLSPTTANLDRSSKASENNNVTPRGMKLNGGIRLDKRQIEQRIEEDRERHKRLRESIWAVNGDDDGEFDRLWEEASQLGEDDYLAAEEDKLERMAASAAAADE